MKTLVYICFLLIQINPIFATEVETKLSFDETVGILHNRYNRADTISKYILMLKFKDSNEKFLLKKALKNGVYDKTLPKMKLARKSDRAVFTINSKTSVEIIEVDRSIWVNGDRLKLEKITDVESLYDQVGKILSKKDQHSIFEFFLPKAHADFDYAAEAINEAVIPFLGDALVFTIRSAVVPTVKSLENLFDRTKRGVPTENLVLLEGYGVRNFKCASIITEVPTGKRTALLPKEIEVVSDILGTSNVKFSYSPEGLISRIEDSRGCKFDVLQESRHLVPEGSSQVADGICTTYGYSAKEYVEKIYGYSRVAKKCEKDKDGTDFEKSLIGFEKIKIEEKAQAAAYQAKLLEEQARERDRERKATEKKLEDSRKTLKSTQ